MTADRPATEPRCNYGAGWPTVVPCQLPDGHRGKHEWMRAASAGADPEPSRRAALQQAMAENGFAYQQQDGSHDLPLRDVDGVIVRLNRRGYDIVPARAQGADYARFKDYVAEMESAGWIVKPANEGRWVPEGEACCGPAAQIIHVQSQGGKIHMGLGERCEDNIVEGAAPLDQCNCACMECGGLDGIHCLQCASEEAAPRAEGLPDDGRWSRGGWHYIACWRGWATDPENSPCVCDRLQQAVVVQSCSEHDEDGPTDEASGFPTCAKCAAILTEGAAPRAEGLDVERLRQAVAAVTGYTFNDKAWADIAARLAPQERRDNEGTPE